MNINIFKNSLASAHASTLYVKPVHNRPIFLFQKPAASRYWIGTFSLSKTPVPFGIAKVEMFILKTKNIFFIFSSSLTVFPWPTFPPIFYRFFYQTTTAFRPHFLPFVDRGVQK